VSEICGKKSFSDMIFDCFSGDSDMSPCYMIDIQKEENKEIDK
jgi:hypothetical protein